MGSQQVLQVFVFLALFGYFANKVIVSTLKWREENIAVAQKMNTSPYIRYPVFTLCPGPINSSLNLDQIAST